MIEPLPRWAKAFVALLGLVVVAAIAWQIVDGDEQGSPGLSTTMVGEALVFVAEAAACDDESACEEAFYVDGHLYVQRCVQSEGEVGVARALYNGDVLHEIRGTAFPQLTESPPSPPTDRGCVFRWTTTE